MIGRYPWLLVLLLALPPSEAWSRVSSKALAGYMNGLERTKQQLQVRYPGTATCGQCYYRARDLAPHIITARPDNKLVANFYTGLFVDGGKGFDCQHAVVVLRDGYSARQFPAPQQIPLGAIKYIVDPDLPGFQTVRSFAAQRNGIRLCHTGPRGPWDRR